MSERTFLFADIAGYTALTEAHGDEQAAELAAEFCRALSELARDAGGSVVKTIGDAAMVELRDARAAVELGVVAATETMVDHGCPAIRVGMHRGRAVERGGDYFGSAVNLAARVAAEATGGEALLTDAARAAAGTLDGLDVVDAGEHRLRGFPEPVHLWTARRAGTAPRDWPIDPVCRMAVAPGHEAGALRHDGVEYRFCSLDCAARFARDPAAFAGA
jgi:adenylate cyclase